MAWTKTKWMLATGVALVVSSVTVLMLIQLDSGSLVSPPQVLDDGSLLRLNQLRVTTRNEFYHGKPLEKFLGNVIPSKGVNFLGIKLQRRVTKSTGWRGKSALAAEFLLTGPRAANHGLAHPDFYRQFRCVIHGETGIDYVQEFEPDHFESFEGGYFGYVTTGSFPRESAWLWFRIEKRENSNRGGPWAKVAEFKIRNPTRPENRDWAAEVTPAVRNNRGLEFVLNDVTLETRENAPRDIWNHVVQFPVQVKSNGLTLTNWSVAYSYAEDASGNWEYLRGHRGLNPDFVWNLEMDMEPETDFPPENTFEVRVPNPCGTMVTNLAGLPVTISWVNSDMLSMQIPTNHTDLAIKFVCAKNPLGEPVQTGASSWGQHGFWKGLESVRQYAYVDATIAIVPNVHLNFKVKPKWINQSSNQEP